MNYRTAREILSEAIEQLDEDKYDKQLRKHFRKAVSLAGRAGIDDATRRRMTLDTGRYLPSRRSPISTSMFRNMDKPTEIPSRVGRGSGVSAEDAKAVDKVRKLQMRGAMKRINKSKGT